MVKRPDDLANWITENLDEYLFCYLDTVNNRLVIADGVDNEIIDTFDLDTFINE
jgi:hypothetical protein